MIYNTDYKENNFGNCIAENITYGESNWIDEDMLELLESSFGPSMISPEYFDKFIKETIELISLVQTVKYERQSKETTQSQIWNHNKLSERLA